MKRRIVKLGLIQSKVSADPTANLKKTVRMVRQAARKGAQIICLQELYRWQYFARQRGRNVAKYLEAVPGGESVRTFHALAKELGVVIVVPLFEKAAGARYNSVVVLDERGRVLPTYRKLHLPQDPGYYEQDYFAKGNLGYRVYRTKFATFAVLICFDQWFPEAARMAKLAGAELIFYPTAIGDLVGYLPPEGDWHDAWETIQRSHAIANSVAVAAVNRVGTEGKTRFWGRSFVTDAFGKVLQRASRNREEALVVKVDLGPNKYIEESWGFIRNRRPDTYRALADRGKSRRGK